MEHSGVLLTTLFAYRKDLGTCDVHLAQFLSNRSHHVMVDGCRSKLVNVVSGVP